MAAWSRMLFGAPTQFLLLALYKVRFFTFEMPRDNEHFVSFWRYKKGRCVGFPVVFRSQILVIVKGSPASGIRWLNARYTRLWAPRRTFPTFERKSVEKFSWCFVQDTLLMWKTRETCLYLHVFYCVTKNATQSINIASLRLLQPHGTWERRGAEHNETISPVFLLNEMPTNSWIVACRT